MSERQQQHGRAGRSAAGHTHAGDDAYLDRSIDVRGRQSRRQFLTRLGLVAGAGAAAPWALELASWANASASPVSASDDYRALVCVFMYGGNDQWNTFVPDDSESYATYAASRSGIARDQSTVLPISPIDGFRGDGTFGMAPELAGVRDLFSQGDAAVVANVGTLLEPLDKDGFATLSRRPAQLFSHNDQQSFWQAGAVEGAASGWGGRIADALLDDNGANSLFTSVSASGNAIMMSGRTAFQYQVSNRGVTTLRDDLFSAGAIDTGLRAVMERPGAGLFSAAYADTTRRGLVAADDLAAAIASANAGVDIASFFDNDGGFETANLTSQLEVVARLIAAGREVLGLKRQVFFVGLGGFDTHSRLVEDHTPLLTALDAGLAGFHRATTAMGLGDRVTTFTASDFGRSLVSNGDGTDHGWGAHHLVVGGAVRGNRVFGELPVVGDDGPNDVGRGRLLPTIAVDQYAATLGRWLGVGESDLRAVAPNLDRFDTADLGLFTTTAPPPPTVPTTTPELICVPADTPGLQPAERHAD